MIFQRSGIITETLVDASQVAIVDALLSFVPNRLADLKRFSGIFNRLFVLTSFKIGTFKVAVIGALSFFRFFIS